MSYQVDKEYQLERICANFGDAEEICGAAPLRAGDLRRGADALGEGPRRLLARRGPATRITRIAGPALGLRECFRGTQYTAPQALFYVFNSNVEKYFCYI